MAEKSKQDVKQEVEQRLREIELSTYLMFPRNLYWELGALGRQPDVMGALILTVEAFYMEHRRGQPSKLAASTYPTPRCLHEM